MKKIIYAVIVMISLSSSVVLANSQSSMKENFATCASSNSSWYQRFGQYIVAFDIYSAASKCRAENSNYQVAGCYAGGQWLQAGYYCQPWNGGN